MIKIKRIDSGNSDFIELVKSLDAELRVRDGDEHAFYSQFNKIDTIQNVVVAYIDNYPVGCGAIRKYSNDVAEIKRMFVPIEYRGQGIGREILRELELLAKELNFSACILETGKKQPEAITLYQRNGYSVIDNYGQYAGVNNSICMQKFL